MVVVVVANNLPEAVSLLLSIAIEYEWLGGHHQRMGSIHVCRTGKNERAC